MKFQIGYEFFGTNMHDEDFSVTIFGYYNGEYSSKWHYLDMSTSIQEYRFSEAQIERYEKNYAIKHSPLVKALE